VPVATVGIGNARNAGLLAARILAAGDPQRTGAIVEFQRTLREASLAKDARVRGDA
jgi:5-(carboxyamino)imidazole ribonucleotide mutase